MERISDIYWRRISDIYCCPILPSVCRCCVGAAQALQIMNFRESGDQDNDHEGNSEEVVIKIMITRKFLESGDQDNDHGVYS